MPVLKQLRVDDVTYDTVGEASVTQVVSTGTKIATISIDGTSTDIYAPSGGGGSVLVFYVQSLTADNTLYADSALTTTAMEFYEYDLAAAWSAVSSAVAIKIMSGYGTTDEHTALVTDVEYDKPEDSIELRYNVGYNNTRHVASIS